MFFGFGVLSRANLAQSILATRDFLADMKSSLSWERRILSNGLTVLLYPRPSAMTTQLSAAVKYGSNDDSEDKIGTAHFLEHMLVGGSRRRIKLLHGIEQFGGCSYFETTNECTFSALDIPPEKLSAASKVLSELIFDDKFETEKLELERKIILNEIADANDDPRDKIEETLIKCLFKHHPVRNPVLGSKKSVSNATVEDIETAHENYYSPRNIVLTLSGKFSGRDSEVLLDGFIDRENGNSVPKKDKYVEVSKPRKEALVKRAGITQAYLSFGLRALPAKSADAPVLDLIDAILGKGESSRLFVELREKRALTYDFESMNVSCSDYGYLLINCAANVKLLEQTRRVIRDEIQKMKNRSVPESELEKSKNLTLAGIFRDFDSPHQLPRLLTDLEIYFEDRNAVVDYIKHLTSISEHTIMEVANRYFQEDNYSEAIMIPRN
jgi:predicted Zn-dependent peptidase